MNETKRIIVEFGVRRQQIHLTDRLISASKLLQRIGDGFDIQLEKNSPYIVQVYDETSNEYLPLEDNQRMFDISRDFQPLHRFQIVNKSIQSQKRLLLDNLQSTVNQLSNATRYTANIQNMIGTLNRNCDQLNQLMDNQQTNSSCNQPSSNFSYLFDPSAMRRDIETPNIRLDNDDDENFESVSSFEPTPPYPDLSPAPIPSILTLNRPQLLTADANIQTRIIPCKYAVRGTCRLGDKCLYLHDEACIQSAREWERRL